MSIQAVAWALDQDIPAGTAKLVLISLANRADHVTGHCWPSIDLIAKEASCSPRSVHTYIGALKRNGYIDVRSGRGKAGKGRTNDYWLIMDRPASPWDWGKGPAEGDPDPLDIDDAETLSATVADTETQHLSANPAHFADTLSATGCRAEPSDSEPSESSVKGRVGFKLPIPPRRPLAAPQALVPGYDPKARQADIARLKAIEAASKAKLVPVIEGTRAWNAHLAAGHPPSLVCNILTNEGQVRRGWCFPTLFPPKSTGPPPPDRDEELGAELARELDEL
jgi:Helix-turn-helix domain